MLAGTDAHDVALKHSGGHTEPCSIQAGGRETFLTSHTLTSEGVASGHATVRIGVPALKLSQELSYPTSARLWKPDLPRA